MPLKHAAEPTLDTETSSSTYPPVKAASGLCNSRLETPIKNVKRRFADAPRADGATAYAWMVNSTNRPLSKLSHRHMRQNYRLRHVRADSGKPRKIYVPETGEWQSLDGHS